MAATLEQIKSLYEFQILQVFKGEEVVKQGRCSQWARHKELKNDKDILYIQLKIAYHGSAPKPLLYIQFHMEDSEGYFSDAMPPEDYLETSLKPGDNICGGLLFALYRDVMPSRLWFDTGILYDNSRDPIFLDIALPIPESQSRTQILAKGVLDQLDKSVLARLGLANNSVSALSATPEQLAFSYSSQVAAHLSHSQITPSEATDALITEVAQRLSIPYKKIAQGYLLRVQLPEGRKQNVIVNFNGKDEQGLDMVAIGTICAPAQDTRYDREFLKMNPQLTYGAIGISPIQGEDFYVITKAYPITLFNHEMAAATIRAIAQKGDWMENTLTGGQDVQ